MHMHDPLLWSCFHWLPHFLQQRKDSVSSYTCAGFPYHCPTFNCITHFLGSRGIKEVTIFLELTLNIELTNLRISFNASVRHEKLLGEPHPSSNDYTTLHHFLSISLDEQQSITGYILLFCKYTICTKLDVKNSLHIIKVQFAVSIWYKLDTLPKLGVYPPRIGSIRIRVYRCSTESPTRVSTNSGPQMLKRDHCFM